MIDVTYFFTFAMVLILFTFYFPKQGKKGLIMNFCKGVIYLIFFVSVLVLSIVKLPQIGWGYSMVILPLLALFSLWFAVRKLLLTSLDFYHKQINTVIFNKYILHRGSVFDDGKTDYMIKGKDLNGQKCKFLINKKTFIDLLDSNGRAKVDYYKYTKIVVSAEVLVMEQEKD